MSLAISPFLNLKNEFKLLRPSAMRTRANSSAPVSEGRDEFTGANGNKARRKFPAVTVNQPVPPPFYTAVAMIKDGNTIVSEARKRIFVPQVVKMVYTPAAIATIRAGMIDGNGVTNITPMSSMVWNTQRDRIRDLAQGYYNNAEANIRFINEGDMTVRMPFSTLTMTNTVGAYGNAPLDYLNKNASDSGVLRAGVLESSIASIMGDIPDDDPIPPIFPITPDEVGFLWGTVAAHEPGHLLGLVASGDVLGGTSGSHNPSPVTRRQIMNAGTSSTNHVLRIQRLLDDIGRNGKWEWRDLNKEYLKFLLPKEEKK